MSAAVVVATDVVLGRGRGIAVARSSFEIPVGSLTAVIGPNGSGKTTLLHALAGLVEPESGVFDWRDGARTAYVLQSTRVNEALPITVRELVTMGRYATSGPFRRLGRRDRRAVGAALEATGASHIAGRSLRQLSGGERQRAFLAQGLAQDHDVLLLDEPLTGLDLPAAQALDAMIHREQTSGRTVVMSTHDLGEARVADYVLLLANRVIACGTPRDVLTAENLRSAYGGSLMHLEGAALFLDDPAHTHEGRHLHRDRSIHVEMPGSDAHPPRD